MSHLSNYKGKRMMINMKDYRAFRTSSVLSWILAALSAVLAPTMFGWWAATQATGFFCLFVVFFITFIFGLWEGAKYGSRFSELKKLRILIDSWRSVLNDRYMYGNQVDGSYSFFDDKIVVQRRSQDDWFVQICDENGSPVVDMLIVKYVIYADEGGKELLRADAVKRDLIEQALSSLKSYVNFNESLGFAAHLATSEQFESLVHHNS